VYAAQQGLDYELPVLKPHSVARGFTSARQTLALMLAALVASAVGLEHAASAQALRFRD